MDLAQKRTAHLLIFLTVLIDLIGFGILIPILQPFAKRFGASDTQAMWLMGIYSLMQFIFSPILGRISDRVGRRPVIIMSLIGSMLGYLVIAQADNSVLSMDGKWSIALLFAARIITGICGASFSTAQAYLADITAPEKRAGVMGMIGAAFGLGFVLGPVIGGLSSKLGLSVPFYIAAAMSLVNALWCWSMLPESLPPEKRGEPRAHSSIPATMRKMAGTGFPIVLISNFFVIMAFSIMTSTFVIWTATKFHFTEWENAKVFGFIGLIAILIQGGLIRRIAKDGRERMLALMGALLMVAGLFILPASAPWIGLLGVSTLLSVGNSLATPTLNALASRCGTVQNQGETMGAMSGAGSLGRFLGPFCAGGLLHYWPGHYTAAYWLAGGLMTAAALCILLIPRAQAAAAAAK